MWNEGRVKDVKRGMQPKNARLVVTLTIQRANHQCSIILFLTKRTFIEHYKFIKRTEIGLDMLAFAIASFFAIALVGALLVIGLMFFGYRERIAQVLVAGLSEEEPTIIAQPPFRVQTIKPRQVILKNRGLQPAPLSAAA